MIELTDYQKKAYSVWKDNGFRGIIEATTGGGKTILGCDCIRQFKNEYPDKKVIVITTSQKVADAWTEQLKQFGIYDVPTYTYGKAINKITTVVPSTATDTEFHNALNYDSKDVEVQYGGLTCDCMIADECQHLSTPAHGKVMRMNPFAILGLSATPEESKDILGEPLYSVSVDEARVCPFTVHMVKFDVPESEMQDYLKLDERMRKRAVEVTGDPNKDYLMPGGFGILGCIRHVSTQSQGSMLLIPLTHPHHSQTRKETLRGTNGHIHGTYSRCTSDRGCTNKREHPLFDEYLVATMIAMLFMHVFADFTLQGVMSNMKQRSWWHEQFDNELPCKYKYDYLPALILHSMAWTTCIMLPILIVQQWQVNLTFLTVWGLMTIVHALVDHLKANQFKINLIQDQLIHIVQIVLVFLMFMQGGFIYG